MGELVLAKLGGTRLRKEREELDALGDLLLVAEHALVNLLVELAVVEGLARLLNLLSLLSDLNVDHGRVSLELLDD